MKTKNLIQCYKVVTLTVLLALLLFVSIVCRSTYYKTFDFPENDPYISFEYPSNYEIAYSERRNEKDVIEYLYFNIFLSNSRSVNDKERIDLFFYFEIEIGRVRKNISEIILEEMQEIRWAIDYHDYQMLRDDSIVISGVKAQLISWSYNYPVVNNEYTRIHEELLSGYNQVVWIIRADYDQSIAGEKGTEFQHLIETFKILE